MTEKGKQNTKTPIASIVLTIDGINRAKIRHARYLLTRYGLC